MHKKSGFCYQKGIGVPINYAEQSSGTLAAEQGCVIAQNNLDVAMKGIGIERMKLKQLSGINYLLKKDI